MYVNMLTAWPRDGDTSADVGTDFHHERYHESPPGCTRTTGIGNLLSAGSTILVLYVGADETRVVEACPVLNDR
jgi:hypothetical protein